MKFRIINGDTDELIQEIEDDILPRVGESITIGTYSTQRTFHILGIDRSFIYTGKGSQIEKTYTILV